MTVSDKLAEAAALKREKNYPAAIAAYDAALANVEVPDEKTCLALAQCHVAAGQPDEALNWLAQLTRGGDDFPAWQAASGLLRKLLKDNPGLAAPHAKRTGRVWLTGSYTLAQLAPLLQLAALAMNVNIEVAVADYGQHRQDALSPSSQMYAFEPDVIVIALHHSDLERSGSDLSAEDIVAEATQDVSMIWQSIHQNCKARILCTNIAAPLDEAFGHLATRVPESRRAIIHSVNNALAMKANELGGVTLVDVEGLSAELGKRAWFDDRYWHLSKQGVSFKALPLLARHMAALIAAEFGLTKKCLVLDLDNTCWGGVIGEDGLAGIKIGQGDAKSEAFLAFQMAVKRLQQRGVILAVCSKNNDADAREPFEKHPEMVLKLDDFAMFVANWTNKAENIKHIAKTLNIGLDSLVFADDNPVERATVREFAPDVDVLPMPEDPAGYVRVLGDYLGFETVNYTREDANKTEQYRAKSRIAEMQATATSLPDFYKSLRMKAEIEPFNDFNMPRIVQLIGKSNQFNLTTYRYSEPDIRGFMAQDGAVNMTLKLADKFTDHGLVSMIMAQPVEDAMDIHLWLMSCRVIGRTVEDALLGELCLQARAQGLSKLRGTYIPTAKNALVENKYADFGFDCIAKLDDGSTIWEYDLEKHGDISSPYIAVSTRVEA